MAYSISTVAARYIKRSQAVGLSKKFNASLADVFTEAEMEISQVVAPVVNGTTSNHSNELPWQPTFYGC